MENKIIQKHNFEAAKDRIQSLSRNLPSSVSFKQFPTKGSIFSLNNHNITGEEANEKLIEPLQSTLITQNKGIRDLFTIANEVFNALDSLDKEYIESILTALKSAEIASNQATTASGKAQVASTQAIEASKKALDASTKANDAQADIKKTIEALKITVSAIKSFKDKVSTELQSLSSLTIQTDSIKQRIKNVEQICSNYSPQINSIKKDFQQLEEYVNKFSNELVAIERHAKLLASQKHLSDIDTIWNDVEGSKTKLLGLHTQLDTLVEKVNVTSEKMRSDIVALQKYRSLIESYTHLGDIDTIWNDVEGHKSNLLELHTQLDTVVDKVNIASKRMGSDIVELQKYRCVLESYTHLGDIDTIWNDVEGHKANLLGLHTQIDYFISETHQSNISINNSIKEIKEQSAKRNIIVDKKIKIAYVIAIGSVTFSAIHLILQLTGVL